MADATAGEPADSASPDAGALLSAYDYELPPAQVAQHPLEQRDSSRLLYLPTDGGPRDLNFRDLPGLLKPGDQKLVGVLGPFPEGARQSGIRPGGRFYAGFRVDLEQ